jgi:hypothetical protein
MSKHVLLEYSTRRKHADVPNLPAGSHYNEEVGYWIADGLPLVRTREFREHSFSKKCDLETGEDQKGE